MWHETRRLECVKLLLIMQAAEGIQTGGRGRGATVQTDSASAAPPKGEAAGKLAQLGRGPLELAA